MHETHFAAGQPPSALALPDTVRDRVISAGRRHAASARHANLLGSLTGFRYDAARIRASDAHSFVISDETLTRTRPKHVAGAIAAIRGLAADCGLRVDLVGYVRPQCQYLDSFAEDVGAGRVLQPFDMYTADEFATLPVSRHPWLDYGRVFAPWRAAFGQRVAITPFERSRLAGGLLRHFLGLLDAVDLASLAGDVPANVRCGAKELEVRRLTALALHRRGTDHLHVVRVLEALDGLSALLVPDAPFAGLSGDRARGLMDRFAAVNAAFARDYRISANGVLFRDPPVDGLARPNRARWSDLSAVEQEAFASSSRERSGWTRVRRSVAPDTGRDARRNGECRGWRGSAGRGCSARCHGGWPGCSIPRSCGVRPGGWCGARDNGPARTVAAPRGGK